MTATDPGPLPARADDDLESLEQEREFLLRSLTDLDDEYEAGDIDEGDYRQLTDDYTARTATVLRAIEAATSPRRDTAGSRRIAVPKAAPTKGSRGPGPFRRAGSEPDVLAAVLRSRRRWRMAAVATLAVVLGTLTAWVMTKSSSSRKSGQTLSGNAQLPAAASGGFDRRLTQASDLVNRGKVTDALKLYDAVLKDDPAQPVALANGGWLLAQAGLAANRSDLVDAGLGRIVQSEKVDSSYTASHFFHGFLLLRVKNDPAGAVTEFRFYLGAVDPKSPEVPQVEALLQEAIKAAGPNVPAGPNAPTTTTASNPRP